MAQIVPLVRFQIMGPILIITECFAGLSHKFTLPTRDFSGTGI